MFGGFLNSSFKQVLQHFSCIIFFEFYLLHFLLHYLYCPTYYLLFLFYFFELPQFSGFVPFIFLALFPVLSVFFIQIFGHCETLCFFSIFPFLNLPYFVTIIGFLKKTSA